MKKTCLLLALVGAVIMTAAPILADDGFYVVGAGGGVGTKITSLPYEIKNPGFYYLTGSLFSTSDCITVSSDDVTLDLMGFRLSSNGSGYSGVQINGYKNVEIRNGTLSGWTYGVNSISGNNHRIINVRVEGNFTGIQLTGWSHLIKGCTISDNSGYGISLTGGGTITGNVLNHNAYAPQQTLAAIYVVGYAMVSGNLVSNAMSHIDLNGTGSIIGNTLKCDPDQFGIYLHVGPVLLDQNTVAADFGHQFSYEGGTIFNKTTTNAGF